MAKDSGVKKANPAEMVTNKSALSSREQSTAQKSKSAKLEELTQTKLVRTAAAWEQVFGTTELLEGILLRLSPRNIVKTERVNKRFKEVIDGSVAISKKDFPDATMHRGKYWGVQRMTGRYAPLKQYVPQGQGDDGLPDHQILSLNTTILVRQGRLGDSLGYAIQNLAFRTELLKQAILRRMRGQPLSMERKFITDPACTIATIYFKVDIGDVRANFDCITVQRPAGITVGDIFDTLLGNEANLGPGGRIRYVERKWEDAKLEEHGTTQSFGRVNAKRTLCLSDLYGKNSIRRPDEDHAKTIVDLENRFNAKARVASFNIILTHMITPSDADIESTESRMRAR